MRSIPVGVHRSARWTICCVLGVVCLFALNARAATPAAANPAISGPASPSAAPAATANIPAPQDIRDIRPPYHIPPGWLWLAWVAAGLFLVAIAYGVWRGWRRLGKRDKLPYEIALQRLEAARRFMQTEQARAFSIAVSEVVRDYIETCFAVRAAHRTTDEFLRDVATRPDSPLLSHQPSLADFLYHCDLAKFARWVLSVPQMEAMLQSAGAFIIATGKPASDNAPPRPTNPAPPAPAIGAATSSPKNLNAQLS